jgi:small subunit ribosomal protein S19
MAKKEFTYKGKSVAELKKLSVNEFADLTTARARRSLKRGLTEQGKILLRNIREGKKNIETHVRDIVIIPEMIGVSLKIYNGKEFIPLVIAEDMLGHCLGEFTYNRKRVAHSAPGIGATKSSAALSVR